MQIAKKDTISSFLRWTPDPTTASLLSLAFPGAGQIYARAYWHSPIFIIFEGYCAWRAVDAWQKSDDLWHKRSSLTPGTTEYEQARAEFEYVTTTRNTYLWMLAGVKLLDIADAYVSAQLFGFNAQMEAPLSVTFLPDRDGARVALNIRF